MSRAAWTMQSTPIQRIDYWALVCSVPGLLIAFWGLESVLYLDELSPFTDYYGDSGVRAIVSLRMGCWAVAFVVWMCWAIRKRIPHGVFLLLGAVLMVLTALAWMELWWGSTFYYGEVRDKQGLSFPWQAVVLFSYVLWRWLPVVKVERALPRWGAIAVATLLQWGVWVAVFDLWNLWQS